MANVLCVQFLIFLQKPDTPTEEPYVQFVDLVGCVCNETYLCFSRLSQKIGDLFSKGRGFY